MNANLNAAYKCLFVAATMFGVSNAIGGAEAQLVVRGNNNLGPKVDARSDPTTVSEYSIASGGSRASAFVSLSKGTLRASSYSDAGQFASAVAAITISDTVTFSSGFGGTAKLWWGLSANISPNAGFWDGDISYASLIYQVRSRAIGNVWGGYTLRNSSEIPCDRPCEIYPSGVVATFQQYGFFTWEITPDPVSFALGLSAVAHGNSEWVNANNTGLFYLELPTGANYSSQSGAFLVDASPIPEPSGLWLAALGVVGINLLFARRSRGQIRLMHMG